MAKKETITIVESRKVAIDCHYNDSVDMKCGGPPTLGFDFFVSADEEPSGLKKWLIKTLEKHGHSCMGIRIDKPTLANKITEKQLWTRDKMEECIQKTRF